MLEDKLSLNIPERELVVPSKTERKSKVQDELPSTATKRYKVISYSEFEDLKFRLGLINSTRILDPSYRLKRKETLKEQKYQLKHRGPFYEKVCVHPNDYYHLSLNKQKCTRQYVKIKKQ